MKCAPRQHQGELVLRIRDAQRAQQQCAKCKQPVGKPIPLFEVDESARRSLPFWLTKGPAERRGNSKRRKYNAFLRTAAWRKIRAEVLAFFKDNCQGQNCSAKATTVHHIRYAKILVDTPRRFLTASCMACNLRERGARIYRAVMGE